MILSSGFSLDLLWPHLVLVTSFLTINTLVDILVIEWIDVHMSVDDLSTLT